MSDCEEGVKGNRKRDYGAIRAWLDMIDAIPFDSDGSIALSADDAEALTQICRAACDVADELEEYGDATWPEYAVFIDVLVAVDVELDEAEVWGAYARKIWGRGEDSSEYRLLDLGGELWRVEWPQPKWRVWVCNAFIRLRKISRAMAIVDGKYCGDA